MVGIQRTTHSISSSSSKSTHSLGQLPSDQASIDENPIPYYFSMLEVMIRKLEEIVI